MSEKQKKPVMTQEENDRMMNRIMLAFVVTVCAVTVIMSIKNRFNTIGMYETAAPVMSAVCIVLFVLSAVFFALRTKKGEDDRLRVITRWNVLGCGITSLLCGIVYAINPSIASVYSVIIVIGVCVLYFIRYIYPLPFRALGAFCLCEGFLIHAGFGLSAVRAFSTVLGILFRCGAAALPAAFLVAVFLAAKKKSAFYDGMKPLWLYICGAAAFVGAVILLLGSFGIFYVSYIYVLYVLAALFLAAGVIQTVKSI
ncbi:MAG: hypothetical protein IJ449_03490 [Clostridia bacterium]|nr:hypothetical protein [Clostridia bacterium]